MWLLVPFFTPPVHKNPCLFTQTSPNWISRQLRNSNTVPQISSLPIKTRHVSLTHCITPLCIPALSDLFSQLQAKQKGSLTQFKIVMDMSMATLNASAKDDDPNFLYVKRRTADGKFHTLTKLDPRQFDGGATLHAAALPLCRSALADNPAGAYLVASLKKPLSAFRITWLYNNDRTMSMLMRTICNSAYEPESDMEEEDYDEDVVGNNGGA